MSPEQGELDLCDFEAVDQVLRNAAQGADQITFDLTDLRFMDLWGLRLLLEAATADPPRLQAPSAARYVTFLRESRGGNRVGRSTERRDRDG